MKALRIGIWTNQALPWHTQVDHWQLVESLGYDTLGIVDHFMPTRGDEDGPLLEGWTLLAALGALTQRVRVAVIVSGNTYRHPVLLAKEAVTVDHISGGRLDLGIGAGWFEREHLAYGFPFPTPGDRVEMLDEAVQVIRALMNGGRTSFAGRFFQLDNAPFAPPPVQAGGIPVMIAGQGDRMLRLAARQADIWNINDSPLVMADRGARIVAHCRAIGRDPDALRWSAFAIPIALDRDPFGSIDDFRHVALAYIAAGADEIQFKMPGDDGNAVLHGAPRIFEELREAHAARTDRPG